MKMSLKLLCLLILSQSEFAYCEVTSSDAFELVKAAHLDVVLLDAFKNSISKKLSESQATNEVVQCVMQYDPKELSTMFASHIASGMTESEINEQVNFYKTPLGQKTVEATLIVVHQSHQIDKDKAVPEFLENEWVQVQSFLKSSTSTKLGNILSSPSIHSEMGTIAAKVVDKCLSK